MGITERPTPGFLDRLGRRFGFTPPGHHGFDTVAAIDAMAGGRAKVFIAMGGNFAAACPDSVYTEAALQRCDLTVHISTKLNRSHLVCGREALILPCLGRTELDVQASGPQRVTVEDSMSMVHASQGRKAPASVELKSEPAIVAGIACATLPNGGGVDWEHLVGDYDRIRELIADVIPGFHDFNQRIQTSGGFYLGNPAARREWNTTTMRARFIHTPTPTLNLPSGQLRLMTIRSHDQFNTTIYDLDDRYRGIKGTREVVFLNGEDMAELGILEGEPLRLSAIADDGVERCLDGFRAVPFDIARGCAAAYFPEANVLVAANSHAIGSRTPVSKFIPVRVTRRDQHQTRQ
jgi:molybdopterin-dependent oxidoreductase alpha subunit